MNEVNLDFFVSLYTYYMSVRHDEATVGDHHPVAGDVDVTGHAAARVHLGRLGI